MLTTHDITASLTYQNVNKYCGICDKTAFIHFFAWHFMPAGFTFVWPWRVVFNHNWRICRTTVIEIDKVRNENFIVLTSRGWMATVIKIATGSISKKQETALKYKLQKPLKPYA